MNTEIKSYVSRYVVPFYFEYRDNGYDKIRERLKENSKWEQAAFWGSKENSEMDLYSYLPAIFQEDESKRNLGVTFHYIMNGKRFEMKYQVDVKSIPFDIKDLGMLLFRNGIGFIWYEIEFKRIDSTADYLDFQNDFKELARTRSTKFVRKVGYDKERREDILEPVCMGEWLVNMLPPIDVQISFWAERTTNVRGNNLNIPDKALLFQYLCLDEKIEGEMATMAFRIANGYDEKYNAPDDIEKQIYRPFKNVCYYISKAGMACIATNGGSNKQFFEEQFSVKYKSDYFFIFTLLVYQTYSCAHYARLLTKLPADEKEFNRNIGHVNKLESFTEQINLFLVKSVFESVSNVHHQNGVYTYGKQTLHVEADIKSLTVGLNALEDMEQGKREGKINSAITLFGLLVVISTVLDALSLEDWFFENASSKTLVYYIFPAGIIILFFILVYIIWANRRR